MNINHFYRCRAAACVNTRTYMRTRMAQSSIQRTHMATITSTRRHNKPLPFQTVLHPPPLAIASSSSGCRTRAVVHNRECATSTSSTNGHGDENNNTNNNNSNHNRLPVAGHGKIDDTELRRLVELIQDDTGVAKRFVNGNHFCLCVCVCVCVR